ncbi:MAG: tetratricopeptide repeat protein [Alphaproteobacteria bacterium]
MQIYCRLFIVILISVATAGCEALSRNQTQASVPPDVSYTASIPTSPDEALRTAKMLSDAGAHDEALHVLASAHRRSPDNAAIMSAYGRLALLRGDYKRAEHLLGKAVAANPDDWRALSALGVLESRKGQHSSARAALGRANTISKRESAALNNLAIGSLLAGHPEKAVRLLRQALGKTSLKAAHARRIKRNLALALAVQGRFAEAEELAGERFPRRLKHAKPAVIRRFLGMGAGQESARFTSRGERGERARHAHANGWRPVEETHAP